MRSFPHPRHSGVRHVILVVLFVIPASVISFPRSSCHPASVMSFSRLVMSFSRLSCHSRGSIRHSRKGGNLDAPSANHSANASSDLAGFGVFP